MSPRGRPQGSPARLQRSLFLGKLASLRAFGNPTFVTVGSAGKVARCVALGADRGFVRHDGSFADAVSIWTNGEGADVILDPVGGSYLADNLAGPNADDRLVIIGLLACPAAARRRINQTDRLRCGNGNVLKSKTFEIAQVVGQDLVNHRFLRTARMQGVVDRVARQTESSHVAKNLYVILCRERYDLQRSRNALFDQ